MFEYFTFSAQPALMNTASSSYGDAISPTNTDYSHSHSAIPRTNMQSASATMNDLVYKLGSQSLNSPSIADRSIYEVQSRPTTALLPSPSEDETPSFFPYIGSAQRDVSTPPADREMEHPNLFSCFHSQPDSRRTQRQIFQEQQCQTTFTRDLQQLLEEMIENGDQCELAEASGTIYSPTAPRGRDRKINTYAPLSCRNHKYSYEDDEYSTSRTSSTVHSSTLTYRASTTSLYTRRSASETRRSSRHRRVASEGNIEIDFDAREIITGGEISLRRAGVPAGVVKMGRLRRKHVPRLRKSRREQLTRRAT